MTPLSSETWKPVVGYEQLYAVSDHGNVRRIAKTAGTRPRELLRPYKAKKGHCSVSLYQNGHGRAMYVHRLVLEAFVGPCPSGMECLYGDGKADNNLLTNLKWGTHKENGEDAVRHGTNVRPRGRDRKHTKLDEETVREVRELDAAGMSQRAIAKRLLIGRGAVQAILYGRSWSWLT